MIAINTVLSSFAAIGMTSMAMAGQVTNSQKIDASDLTYQVAQRCRLAGWQVSIRMDGAKTLYPEVSPTITPDQKACVDDWLANSGWPIATPGGGAPARNGDK